MRMYWQLNSSEKELIFSCLKRTILPDAGKEPTMQSCHLRPGGYKWPTLSELHAACFNSAYTPANNARADVIAAARCFIKLMKSGQLEDLFD